MWSCPTCRLVAQSRELKQLKKDLDDLRGSVSSLSSKIDSLEAKAQPVVHQLPLNPPPSTQSEQLPQVDTSRKFNLIFHNISASPSGTSFAERLDKDLAAVTAISGSHCPDINPAIWDCIRLGKYRVGQSQPRPILVKFNNIKVVRSVLFGHSNTDRSGVVIKQDLSKEERHITSILLKERYRLVSEDNVEKGMIKIRGPKIFVNNRLHGTLQSGTFIASNSLGATAPFLLNLTSDGSSVSSIEEHSVPPTSSIRDQSSSD